MKLLIFLLASLRLPAIFTSGMALQQNDIVPVWGYAEPCSKVSVSASWARSKHLVQADSTGYFCAAIATPSCKNTPYGTLTIRSGKEQIVLDDILFAEVWVAMGQSNMEMPLRGFLAQPCAEGTETVLHSGEGHPVRVYLSDRKTASTPQQYGSGHWLTCSPATTWDVSACAYFFARTLTKALDCPVAIVQCVYGATKVQAWMSKPVLEQTLGHSVEVPDAPTYKHPCGMYNQIVHPVERFAMRGMIYYQGESNSYDTMRYESIFPTAVRSWRKAWKREFPFFYAQIAPFYYDSTLRCASIQEQQAHCLDSLPSSGMVVTSDLGDSLCIHYVSKRPVGQRLAMQALNKVYGYKDLPCESPSLDSVDIREGKCYVRIKNVPDWIYAEGDCHTMQVAGEDGIFYPANMQITFRELIVWSEQVPSPKHVRYCYLPFARSNIFSTTTGLPLAPFRTDNY